MQTRTMLSALVPLDGERQRLEQERDNRIVDIRSRYDQIVKAVKDAIERRRDTALLKAQDETRARHNNLAKQRVFGLDVNSDTFSDQARAIIDEEVRNRLGATERLKKEDEDTRVRALAEAEAAERAKEKAAVQQVEEEYLQIFQGAQQQMAQHIAEAADAALAKAGAPATEDPSAPVPPPVAEVPRPARVTRSEGSSPGLTAAFAAAGPADTQVDPRPSVPSLPDRPTAPRSTVDPAAPELGGHHTGQWLSEGDQDRPREREAPWDSAATQEVDPIGHPRRRLIAVAAVAAVAFLLALGGAITYVGSDGPKVQMERQSEATTRTRR